MADLLLPLLAAAVFLLAGACALFLFSGSLRRRSGLPPGQIVASDMSGKARKGRPLYSARYGLSGVPDYVLGTRLGHVPVEVKPGRHEREPHESHLWQVLAYCLLIEENEGKAPPYGLLRYSEETFRVEYNPESRSKLLALLEEIRQSATPIPAPRNHSIPGRCRACAYRSICDMSLWRGNND